MTFHDVLCSLIARVALCAGVLAAPVPVLAQTTAAKPAVALGTVAPAGPVVLTLRAGGADAASTAPMALDQAMLEQLPQVSFTTTTIWTDGPQEFTGVPLSALLAAAGLAGTTVVAMAANDYQIEIPLAELGDKAPIVAYQRNGKPMTTRDKGPLWIVYPYDSDPAYRSEVVYARSIWQLEQIEVLP